MQEVIDWVVVVVVCTWEVEGDGVVEVVGGELVLGGGTLDVVGVDEVDVWLVLGGGTLEVVEITLDEVDVSLVLGRGVDIEVVGVTLAAGEDDVEDTDEWVSLNQAENHIAEKDVQQGMKTR